MNWIIRPVVILVLLAGSIQARLFFGHAFDFVPNASWPGIRVAIRVGGYCRGRYRFIPVFSCTRTHSPVDGMVFNDYRDDKEDRRPQKSKDLSKFPVFPLSLKRAHIQKTTMMGTIVGLIIAASPNKRPQQAQDITDPFWIARSPARSPARFRKRNRVTASIFCSKMRKGQYSPNMSAETRASRGPNSLDDILCTSTTEGHSKTDIENAGVQGTRIRRWRRPCRAPHG